jgi:hypothetical protein
VKRTKARASIADSDRPSPPPLAFAELSVRRARYDAVRGNRGGRRGEHGKHGNDGEGEKQRYEQDSHPLNVARFCGVRAAPT